MSETVPCSPIHNNNELVLSFVVLHLELIAKYLVYTDFFFQIRSIKEPLAVLQEFNRSTVGQLSPVDVISYVEALSVSYPFLSTVNYTVSDKEALTNVTINVSDLSLTTVFFFFYK